ncbi:unnamed protein product [Triticum turgidum subsp. durum]|uniref:60S ribosomal protein L35a n=1 Tax=Triticum turgidum subsp. durum TaxID=4567 RepID=A0A9R1QSN9_TRITD|nr:unnamed protein product [Triticum turgidum subsp. durum]
MAMWGLICRSKSNQYESTSLVQVEGVNTKEDVAWYAGKRLAYVYKAKTKSSGTCYRCLWGKITHPHGNSGIVRAQFKSNLPAEPMVRAQGQSVHVPEQHLKLASAALSLMMLV